MFIIHVNVIVREETEKLYYENSFIFLVSCVDFLPYLGGVHPRVVHSEAGAPAYTRVLLGVPGPEVFLRTKTNIRA